MKFFCFVFLTLFKSVIALLPSHELAIADIALIVEIADTEQSRRRGLMFRQDLPEGRGMLFIHETPQILSYWMKNTYIPLSIAFFDSDHTLLNIEDMPSCEEERSLKSFRSKTFALYALEVPRGWFEKHNIKPGMKFSFRDPSKSVQ
ncbi:MAG: DUF192 domain-containing protein [Chlamydiales bacterium]|nr:DUF192 domain-containing protein [Chlamydiales bacterium]